MAERLLVTKAEPAGDQGGNGRAGRSAPHYAGAAPLPAHRLGRAAARRLRGDRRRGQAGRQVPAARLSPAAECGDIALGYQQLLHVERGWWDLTAQLELRPRSTTAANKHRRAHVLLCWLALLLVRFIGTRTGRPGRRLRGPDRPGRHLRPGPANHPPPPARCWPRWRSPRRGRSWAWLPPPHGARRGRHLQVLPAEIRPGPRSTRQPIKDRKKWRPAAHAIWCCG